MRMVAIRRFKYIIHKPSGQLSSLLRSRQRDYTNLSTWSGHGWHKNLSSGLFLKPRKRSVFGTEKKWQIRIGDDHFQVRLDLHDILNAILRQPFSLIVLVDDIVDHHPRLVVRL